MLVQSKSIASTSDRSAFSLNNDRPLSRPSAIATRVILIRHGRSTYNQQGRYQGRCDRSVLTERGLEDAYRTGGFLQQIQQLATSDPIGTIYTSPLQRTRQTANQILAVLGNIETLSPRLKVDRNLEEIDMYSWQGLTYQYVRENFPQEYRCWQERPHEFENPTGTKPLPDLYQRARQFWSEILSRHKGETIAIVSHGGTNRALMATAMGMSADRYHALQQCNCGVSVLQFPADLTKPARLSALNLTAHLGRNLPKLKNGKSGLRLLLLPTEIPHRQVWQVARFLHPQSPNVILSTDLERSTQIAESLLESHSSTVHLQVLRDDIVWNWAEVIKSRPRIGASQKPQLVTGLAIVPQAAISKFLQKLCGCSSLTIDPGTLSVLHFSQERSQPVLQGLIPMSV